MRCTHKSLIIPLRSLSRINSLKARIYLKVFDDRQDARATGASIRSRAYSSELRSTGQFYGLFDVVA